MKSDKFYYPYNNKAIKLFSSWGFMRFELKNGNFEKSLIGHKINNTI